MGGYSLHAAVRVPRGARARLEKLCRYAARPPIVPERMKLSRDGRKVVYVLKRRWRDGSTHVVLDPLTLLARLAALIPRPRVHLTTYHGVLAPAVAGRAAVVPATSGEAAEPARCEGVRGGRARELGRRRRYSWAELMKRVFAVDVLRCPRCGAGGS